MRQDAIDQIAAGNGPEETEQARFEKAVLAVLARVLTPGARIDLAVADHLEHHPMVSDAPYLRPDLIISVSDCRRLILQTVGRPHEVPALLSCLETTLPVANAYRRLIPGDGVTRIQAAIGNIRRALAVVTSPPPSPRS